MCAVSVRHSLRSGTHSVAFSAQHVNELMAEHFQSFVENSKI
jgi:hypothetical protein